ncbi:putative oligonucleotide/oligosaccharide-binding domain-containing protein [Hamiltosporidium tvaerminnensis]|uniref:Putative oligonucleotide/oligosaccharide-binding domain-containing protein n=1 Tax=Hamiltosporidium tvaerminnensis TaxID=1176355 RepID=A0A4Q9M4W0_9MICR|nr:putative oligonucleotide/oligosaccharide-binding domain-containing protein [Hamiltosporidium tvaerminnensis]
MSIPDSIPDSLPSELQDSELLSSDILTDEIIESSFSSNISLYSMKSESDDLLNKNVSNFQSVNIEKKNELEKIQKNNSKIEKEVFEDFSLNGSDSLDISTFTDIISEGCNEQKHVSSSVSFESDDFSDELTIESKKSNDTIIYKNKNFEIDFSKNFNSVILTGFSTGNNKKIAVKEETLKRVSIELEKEDETKSKNKDNLLKNEETKRVNTNSQKKNINTSQNKDDGFLQNESLEKINIDLEKKVENIKKIKIENLPEKNIKKEFSMKSNNLIKKGNKNESFNISGSKIENTFLQEQVGNENRNIIKNTNVRYVKPIRMYNKPEKGHHSTEKRYLEKMANTFKKIEEKYKNEEKEWIFQNFKWTWMSLFVSKWKKESLNGTQIIENQIIDLEENILFEMLDKKINLKKRKEYSILRRICEGDDISYKYMILLIVGIHKNTVELYDGFYSVECIYDKEIEKRIISQKIKIFDKIKIFGAELLEEPKSFFERKGVLLRLNANGFVPTSLNKKLGYQKKVGFVLGMNKICKTGGTVGCVEIKVKKIVEEKALIRHKGYKKEVKIENIEEEVEKVYNMAKKEGVNIEINDINISKNIKIIAECLISGFEALITIWGCEYLKIGDRYRFIFLKINEKATGLHLITFNRSVVQQI